jgi:molybdopterin-guanine dinucleotide biosynthesis protein A
MPAAGQAPGAGRGEEPDQAPGAGQALDPARTLAASHPPDPEPDADNAVGPLSQVPAPAAGLAAIVLAGGRATRLGGADKPGLVVGGRTLIAAVVAAAAGAGAGHVVVVGPARSGLGSASGAGSGSGPAGPPSCRVEFVREEPPGAGPVAALRRGLAEVRAPVVAVLAADMPFLRSRHLTALLRELEPAHRGAILLDDTGAAQWLAGCWDAGALRAVLAGYAGNSLRGLLEPLRPATLSYPLAAGEPPPWLDCDTASDLSQARDLARRRL